MYLSCLKILLGQFWMIFKRVNFFGSTKNIHCHLKDPLLWNINNSPYQSCSKKICSTDFTVGFFEHLEKKIQATQLWRTATTKPQHEFSFKDFIPRSPLNNNRKRIRTNRFLNRELFAWLHCILIGVFLFCTMGQIKQKYMFFCRNKLIY